MLSIKDMAMPKERTTKKAHEKRRNHRQHIVNIDLVLL